MVGRDPLPILRTGSVTKGDSLVVDGHGITLPMKASGGAEGVGNATRNTVVISMILIIAFNYFVTSITQWIT